MKLYNGLFYILKTSLFFLVAGWGVTIAQHRGDDLAFQGLSFPNESGVKAVAMGSAYTSVSGDINALFWNTAGLAKLEKIQLFFSVNRYQKIWRENQVYRTNRYFLTLPFYLEKLYIPDPKNNGKWDYEVFASERDSTYNIADPKMGLDVFSKEAAEWQKNKNDSGLDNLSIAVPLKLGGRNLAIAAAYNKRMDVLDFDRNDTYLDPHLGYTEYGAAERVSNDTLRVNWSEFQRSRFGTLHSITAGLAYDLHKNIQVGFGFSSYGGETQDQQSLNRVGWFDLLKSNRFIFSYDTLNSVTKGTSQFSAFNYHFGTILSFEHFSIGIKAAAPYTLERKWSYSTQIADTLGTTTSNRSGTDTMTIPAAYTLGVSVMPVANLLVSFDFESIPYSRTNFSIADNGTLPRKWVDQNTVRFGMEYKPVVWLAFLAGYKNVPATFVPDGAAFRDRGPIATSYTGGMSVETGFGRLDLAYEVRMLKYYDSYYSNTNYVYERFNNLLLGYTLSF